MGAPVAVGFRRRGVKRRLHFSRWFVEDLVGAQRGATWSHKYGMRLGQWTDVDGLMRAAVHYGLLGRDFSPQRAGEATERFARLFAGWRWRNYAMLRVLVISRWPNMKRPDPVIDGVALGRGFAWLDWRSGVRYAVVDLHALVERLLREVPGATLADFAAGSP